MNTLHVQLDLFLTGGTYHAATCRYANYVHPDQPLYPARIQDFSFSQELPDPLVGGLAKRSASVTLSDQDLQRMDSPTLAAILATENPKGKRARLRLWDSEAGTFINSLNGIISSIGQDYRSLTIEGENPALLQNMLPVTRALDLYPSLDTSQMESKDPPPIVVFGQMPRVTLGCALATALSFTAVMGGGEADKFVFVDMTGIPNYTVASGDRLVYDLYHGGAGWWQALDLRCSDGTVLRNTSTFDQNGINARPGQDVDTYANGLWYRRDIPLTALVGKTITEYMLGSDNNTAGSYTSLIANAYILDANDVKKAVIFDETITTVTLAYQSRNNVLSTTTATINQNWFYGPIRPAASGTLSVNAVYVDGRVRAAGTYSFITGADGYRFIQFSARPLASQGGVAKVQADLNSTEFESNPALVAKFVWQDAGMLGQTVNGTSFVTAQAMYASIGDYEKVVGGLAERKQALQILRDLSFRGAYFDLNDSNQVTMTVDDAAIHVAAPVNLGQQDDLNLRNAEVKSNNSLSNSIASEPKQLDFLAYRDPGLGSSGQPSYLISATRSRSTGGVTLTRESPHCGSGKMADREAGYNFAVLVSQDFDIEIVTGATIGKQLSLGHLVRFYSPKHYFSGVQSLLSGIRFDGSEYTLRLTGWDAARYAYTPGKVTVSRLVDAIIDYSQTTPSTPTSPTFISASVSVIDDGAAVVIEKWRVTLPPTNCTELRVLAYRTGTGQAAPFQSVNKTIITLGGTNDIEIAVPVGMVYDLEFYAFNGGNQPEHRYSLPALVTGHTAATDTSEPGVPTGLAATVGTGQVVSLNWNDNPELDLSEYRVYRSLTTPPNVQIAEVAASRFVDVNVVIGTQYHYAISAVDRTENESDKCAEVLATPVIVPGTDTGVIPNTPAAPTFSAEGTYLSADGNSAAFVEVNNPAMPTNGVVMNILYRPSGSASWGIADQVSSGGGVSRVDDLISGRVYLFAAQAYSAFGRGSIISPNLARTAPHDTSDPGVPTGLVATVGTGKVVSLNWNDSTALDFSEYIVYRSNAPTNPPVTKIAEVAASRFVDVNVVIGQTYFYAISAVDRTENESAKCSAVPATPVLIPGDETSNTIPNTPTAPTFDLEGTYFSADGTSVAFIQVNNPAMPTNGALMNIIYRSTGTSAWSIADQVSAGGGISRVDDLIPDRDYLFAAQAYSVFGRGSIISPTLFRTAPHDTSGPAVPTGLSATVGTGKVVSLDWNDSTAEDFSEYVVYRDLTNPPTTKIAEVAASRFVDVNVLLTTPPTQYFYAISSVDRTENESAKCTAVAASPILIPGTDTSTTIPGTPAAPTFNAEGTYFSADGASVAFIQVNNPAMPTNGAVMNILYKASGSLAWSIADQVSAGGGDSRVDDLIPGRAYIFAAQAYSVFGRGSIVSAGLSRTAPFDTIAPAVPTLVAVEPFNQRAILVDWTDVTTSDLNEYALYRQEFTNLVDNYGFEEFEFTGWTKVGTPGGGEAFIQGGIHTGARAANIVSLGTPLLLSQNITITNGATYTLAGWARVTSRTSGAVQIRVNTGNGTFATALSLTTVGLWTFGDVTFTATGTTAQVQCYVTGGPCTGYFDDIALFAGTPNPTTKIAEIRASRFTDSQFFIVGSVYYYAVAAIDRTENESAKSNFMAATPVRISNEDLSKYTPQPLGALSISSTGTYQSNDGTTLAFVNLSWSNPTDANRAFVEVAFRRNGNTVSYLIADQVSGTTARVDDLTPGLTYDYRVRGLSQVGVFGAASTLNNQVAPGDSTVPTQVVGLTLLDHPPRGILARWLSVSAIDLAHYQVQSDRNSGFTNATGALVTRTVKTTELPLTGLVNGATYWVRVRAIDLSGNAGSYSTIISRTVPRSGSDDQDDDSIGTLHVIDLAVTTAKIGSLAVTTAKIDNLAVDNAKIANLAVTNAKINDLSAVKITTGLLTINPSTGGATALFVDNAGKIRLKAILGTPSKIVFEDASAVEKAQIQGKPFELDIDPTSDGGLNLALGEVGLRWDTILMNAVNRITPKCDNFFIDGKLGTPNVESSAPVLATPNRRLAVYNSSNTFVCYLWGSTS